jgi:murein DD-endopeptidase / murein LD-carboxypeptidase
VLKSLFVKDTFVVLKNCGNIKLLMALVLLISYACKHKQQVVNGIEKKVVKKESNPKKTNDIKLEEGNDGNTALTQKLGLTGKEIKQSKLYSFIADWYGIPYKYGGCQKAGVDCSCFISILSGQVYSHELPRTAGEMFNQCDKIAGNEAREGDLLFFKINSDKISHVAVYVKKDFFVHASTSKGVMLSNINEAYYKKYFFCAGRIKKS